MLQNSYLSPEAKSQHSVLKKILHLSLLVLCSILICFQASYVVFAQQTTNGMSEQDIASIYGKHAYYEDCSASSPTLAQKVQDAKGPVYILGDSITEMSEADIQQAFNEAGLQISKINGDSGRAISRDTVTGDGGTSGLKAVEEDTEAIKKSNAIVIALGTNSSGGVEDLNVQIPKIIKEVRKANADAPIFWVNVFSKGGVERAKLNKIIKDRSTEDDYTVVDTVTPQIGDKDVDIKVGSDGVHPTPEGSKTFAKIIASGLKTGVQLTSIPTNGEVKTTKPTPSTKVEVGDAFKGRATNYGWDTVTGYTDPMDNNQPQTGISNEIPGIAVYNYGTAKGWWLVTTDKGKSAILQQTDVGPGADTAFIDINTVAVRSVFGGQQGNSWAGNGWTFKYLGQKKPAGAITKDTGDKEPTDRTGASPNETANGSPSSVSDDCVCTDVPGPVGPISTVVENLDKFSPDPAMEKMFNDQGLPQIKKFLPLYQEAAMAEGMPQNWEILAGLHWTETEFGRTWTGNGVQTVTGPFQENTSELAPYLDNPEYADLKTLVAPGGGLIGDGKQVNDKEFVVLARLALANWVKQALGNDYEKLKTAPVPFQETVDSNNVFWRIMGRWNGGAEGFQGFTGYNNTNYKAPQPVTGNYGTGLPWNKPGVATTYYLLKKHPIGSSVSNAGCMQIEGEGGTLVGISGDRAELVKRVLESPKLKLGNYGNGATQRTDIQSVITDDTLKMLVALVEQSGVTIPVNAIKSDHGAGTAHEVGKAVDIGYYGNGQPNHTADGDKLFKFIYNNRAALKVQQLIWWEPPRGYKCVNKGEPVSCESDYASILGEHVHHIHVGL